MCEISQSAGTSQDSVASSHTHALGRFSATAAITFQPAGSGRDRDRGRAQENPREGIRVTSPAPSRRIRDCRGPDRHFCGETASRWSASLRGGGS